MCCIFLMWPVFESHAAGRIIGVGRGGPLQWVAVQALAAEVDTLDVGAIRNVAVVPAPFVPLNSTLLSPSPP